MTNHRRHQAYKAAQSQAEAYLVTLVSASHNAQTYATLTDDICQWRQQAPKHNRLHELSFYNSPAFIANLAKTRKLKQYLADSLYYLYMRDLDLDIGDPETAKQIEQLAQRLTDALNQRSNHATINFMQQGFHWAQRQQCEDAFIWLSAKVYRLRQLLPSALDAHQGLRKLLKVVAGVLLATW